MLRIYLDWNQISYLKNPDREWLRDYLRENKHRIIVPFTPTHFADSKASHDHPKFRLDMDTLTEVSQGHFMEWRMGGLEPVLGTPEGYFDFLKKEGNGSMDEELDLEKLFADADGILVEQGLPKVGETMKTFFKSVKVGHLAVGEGSALMSTMFPDLTQDSTLMDMFRGFGKFNAALYKDNVLYRQMRKDIADGGISLKHMHAATSTELTILIDAQVKKLGLGATYIEYIDSLLEHQKNVDDKDRFIQAYNVLDMIGFRSDPLTKPTNSMDNVRNDAEHAFYAAHCDVLVSDDAHFIEKAKVIYEYFGISTRVVHSRDLITTVKHMTAPRPKDFRGVMEQAVDLHLRGIEVERHSAKEGEHGDWVGRVLPSMFMDFFTHSSSRFVAEDIVEIDFLKIFDNYSRFLYPTEFRSALRSLTDYLPYVDSADVHGRIEKLLTDPNAEPFGHRFDEKTSFFFSRDEHHHRPVFTIWCDVPQRKPSSDQPSN